LQRRTTPSERSTAIPTDPGKRLAHYTLIEKIGQGGMGEVHRAEDTRLRREVAIKVLPPELASDPERLSRFRREAEAIAALSHPNIVTVFSIEEEEGVHFMSMELVRGSTLGALIPKGGLPADRFLDLATTLADAVSAAHQQGITHRDLKPENVMISGEGRLKVLDFGLARMAEAGGGGAPATQLPTTAKTEEGKVMGTVAYMSPEQAEGKPVDPRSDVFSLGVVLYEMATGQRPFTGGSTASIISSILRDSPPPPSEVNGMQPRGLDRIVRRCLAKDPSRRYQVALEVRNELELLREEAAAKEGMAPEEGAAAAPRRSVALPVAASAITALGILAAGWLWLGGRPAGSGGLRPAHFTRLTGEAGADLYPSISPDGRNVAFVRSNGHDLDIWVQRVGGRKALNLTPGADADDTMPAFSPDGGSIAFRSKRDGGGIFVMGATGESVKRLTREGCHPAWSPDGTRLAYTSECVENPASRGGRSLLKILDLAGGEARALDVPDAVQPSWSPSGKRIAYWLVPAGSGQRDLATVGADGTGERFLTRDAAMDWNPVWSPDGRWIYFSSDRGGTMSLWRIPVEEATGEPRGVPEPVTAELTGTSQHLSIAADGRRIAFASALQLTGIQKAPFDSMAGRLTGAPQWVMPPSSERRFCAVSPEGGRLGCYSMGSAHEDIFITGIDGSDLRLLTDDVARDRRPVWAPDGRSLYFYSNRTGSYEIWAINVDGSGLRQLTGSEGQSLIWPVISPDGLRLIAQIMDGEGRRSLLVETGRSPAEQEYESLPPTPAGIEAFSPWDWSHDGKRLVGVDMVAFPVMRGVVTLELESGTYRRFDVQGLGPIWAGDDRMVLISDESRIRMLDTESGRLSEILDVAPDRIGEFSLSLSPDGRTLYFSRRSAEADLWIADLEGPPPAP
jgi:Tol biopolymer transport system component